MIRTSVRLGSAWSTRCKTKSDDETLPPSKLLTGPASPLRSVCTLGRLVSRGRRPSRPPMGAVMALILLHSRNAGSADDKAERLERHRFLAQRCLAETRDRTIESRCRGEESEKRCGDKKTGMSAPLAARRAAPIVLRSGRSGPQSLTIASTLFFSALLLALSLCFHGLFLDLLGTGSAVINMKEVRGRHRAFFITRDTAGRHNPFIPQPSVAPCRRLSCRSSFWL
jgi:hypothetical protein